MESPSPFFNGQTLNEGFLNQNVRDKIIELQQFNSTAIATVQRTTAQALTYGTWIKLNGATVIRSIGGNWTNGGSTTDLLRTPVAGWYGFNAYVVWSAGLASSSRRLLQLAANGPTPGAGYFRHDLQPSSNVEYAATLGHELYLPANQEVALWGWQDSSTTGVGIAQVRWGLRLISPDVTA